MLAKNLKISSPIILIKLIGSRRLAILVDIGEYAIVRIIDNITQKPLASCKLRNKTNNMRYYIVDDFIVSYDDIKKHIEIVQLDTTVVLYTNDKVLNDINDTLTALCMTKNGYNYATGDSSGVVKVWNPKVKEYRYAFKQHTSNVSCLSFNKSNNMLLSGGDDGAVILYALEFNEKASIIMRHDFEIVKIYFIDKVVMSSDKNGTINIYDLEKKEIVNTVKIETGVKDIILAYERSCYIVLTQDDEILLINMQNLTDAPLKIDTDVKEVNSMTFDDENKKLILSTNLGHLLFYDLGVDNKVIAYNKVDHNEKKINKDFVFMTVDDSKLIRTVVKSSISQGFKDAKVIEASNGQEALNLLNEVDVNCLILDWNMPGFSGGEVLKYIRAIRKFDHIKIIMATTEGERSRIVSAIKDGADGYIVKPFSKESFKQSVLKYLNPNQVERK